MTFLNPDPYRPKETDLDDPVPRRNGCAVAMIFVLVFWGIVGAGVLWVTRPAPRVAAESPTRWTAVPPEVFRPLPAVTPLRDPVPSRGVVSPTEAAPAPVPAPPPRPRGPGIRVALTWYCLAGRSRCTKGYPDTVGQQLYAAASPDLLALGWRNRVVRILYGGVDVYVRIVDCSCQAYRSLDLFSDAFRALAPLGMGRITATAVLLR